MASLRDVLEARYAEDMASLKAKISGHVRLLLEERTESAFRRRLADAHRAEREARDRVDAATERMGDVETARALVDHARGKWIGGADKGIAAARARLLDESATEEERRAAEEELGRWEQNHRDGERALEERSARLREAEMGRAGAERELAEGQEELVRARRGTEEALRNILDGSADGAGGLRSLLQGPDLDADLARFQVVMEATPAGLAAFASTGDAEQMTVADLLADDDLLVQMAVADGARAGRAGRAMEIYRAIQDRAHRTAREAGSVLQRLALATSLEHAEPYAQRNAVAETDAPETIDPVNRYLHYEEAYLAGELDPAFEELSVWDMRMVVEGEHGTPDHILAWGRQMLRNYRPDLVLKDDYTWRYVEAVRSEIRYGSQDNQHDRDDLHFFQNILMNGGICGRRAFFGRFVLRAHGIPTTARPSPGHGALTHWTPGGWVVCLGAGWGKGWTKTRYGKDLDFLANTRARATGERFMRVQRARWIGDVMGESRCFGLLSAGRDLPFWNAVALYAQRSLVEGVDVPTVKGLVVGKRDGNARQTTIELVKGQVAEKDCALSVIVDEDGVITVPASATSKPTRSTGKILFMDCTLGGKQLHYSRNGGHQEFEYLLNIPPTGGRYALTARVVTPSWKQNLLLCINGAKDLIDISLPFTVGMWGTTEPVEISLAQGTNSLCFSRVGDVKGVTIKDFTLAPRTAPAHPVVRANKKIHGNVFVR